MRDSTAYLENVCLIALIYQAFDVTLLEFIAGLDGHYASIHTVSRNKPKHQLSQRLCGARKYFVVRLKFCVAQESNYTMTVKHADAWIITHILFWLLLQYCDIRRCCPL